MNDVKQVREKFLAVNRLSPKKPKSITIKIRPEFFLEILDVLEPDEDVSTFFRKALKREMNHRKS